MCNLLDIRRFLSAALLSLFFVCVEEVYDVVEVGTGANPADPSSRIKTISGSMATEEFNTLTNTLWVTFTSDGSNTDQGFSMTFSEGKLGCLAKCLAQLTKVYPQWKPQ